MLRWLLYVVMAVWAARLVRAVAGAPRRRMSDFDPAAGATHPARGAHPGPGGQFSAGEIVDAEFEEVPSRRQP